jgi:hypothetical protein
MVRAEDLRNRFTSHDIAELERLRVGFPVIHPAAHLATFRRKKPFSDDRATKLGARTRRQVAADKL